MFKELFNYNANYFTPPSQTYHQSLEKTLIENGINIIDVPLIHKMPLGNGKYTTRLHYLGQRNQFKQIYLTRNVVFEPNISDNDDGVNVCLKGIETAFKYRRPAIISNHRVAFVGGIEPQNRDKGLKSLKRLMSSILKKWPDSEFMSVVDLPFLN